MHTSEVIGAEALIRWNNPLQGILYPDDFLPTICNRPLILDLDLWVLNEVCTQLCKWHNDGFDSKISVNISAYTFKQPNFIALVDETLARYPHIMPHQIDIEIIESSLLHDIQEVHQIIEELHKRKITVSLDDFGTGYSTLSYLKELGVDTLKIDMSFVVDILKSSGDLSIVDASVSLAEAFKAQPLAEGVESVEHGDMLLKLGCNLAQGYVISYPMNAELFPAWSKEYKAPRSWKEF